MRPRLSFLLAIALSSAAMAQEDWNTFPPSQPAPQPQPVSPAPRGLKSQPPVQVPAQPAAQPAPQRLEDGSVVTSQERLLPGTEPHSPSTWANTYNAKRNLRQIPGVGGSIGLLHVSSADLGPRWVLRFSATGEYFSKKDFPVLTASNVRSAGTFAISFVPLEFLEAFLSYAATANTNTNSSPRLIQSLGDVGLGVKGARQFAKGFYAGLELKLQTFSGVGNQDVRNYAVGFAPRAIATYDLREPFPKIPARLHGNIGAIFDGSGGLVSTHKLVAAEEYALGVNQFHRFTFGAGLEVPLPAVTPYLEYNLAVPLGVPGGQLDGPDGVPVTVAAAMPQTLGLGLKVTAIKDLTLGLAMDFGLTRRVGLGVPATPPFNFLFSAAFNVDPFQRGETRVLETVREAKATKEEPKTGKVEGTVVDAATHKPIPGVIVAMVGAGLPPVASDADSGKFLTHELPSGKVKLAARKDGYKASEREVTLEAGKTANVELALEQEVRKAAFLVSATSKKKPVVATVTFKGPQPQQVALTEANKDPFKIEGSAGKYEVNVIAPGYLAQTREVQVSEGAEMAVAFDLTPEPKKSLVIVKDNKIEILQQVHFATGKATILADSFPLLAQVVDAIVKNDLKRVRIEGHTDNKGQKAKNQQLSEDRAKSVADYLSMSGIDKARLETAGFGDSRPVAPNLTARGRELNRRVEFLIIER